MNWRYHMSRQPLTGKSIEIKDFAELSSTPVPKPLVGGLVLIVGILTYGLFLLHRDRGLFRVWIREDGLVEWLTFVELFIMSGYSFMTSNILNHRGEEKASRMVWQFLAFLFLFGAMEEISWGQRILGVQSPEWFLKHNRQGETNIHNLMIYGVNINKFIFGKILAMILGVYLIIVPLLFRHNEKLRDLVNRWRIPVAQNYQILLFIILIIVVRFHLHLSKKVDELLELCSCFFILLTLTHPYNDEILAFKGWATRMRRTFQAEVKGTL